MKFTAAAILLPVLGSAVHIDARQATDLKYEISNFTAACTVESIYCFYGISIVTSDNPEFVVSCEAMGTSENGDLPAVSETQCGTYTIAFDKPDNGELLVLTVTSDGGRLTGTHTLSHKDLEISTGSDHTVQSYGGDTSFTIDVKNASSASASASASDSSTIASTPTASSSPSASSPASSVTSTTTSEPSTTGGTTSGSASPSETNGATRESAFAGVMLAGGLIAAMF